MGTAISIGWYTGGVRGISVPEPPMITYAYTSLMVDFSDPYRKYNCPVCLRTVSTENLSNHIMGHGGKNLNDAF